MSPTVPEPETDTNEDIESYTHPPSLPPQSPEMTTKTHSYMPPKTPDPDSDQMLLFVFEPHQTALFAKQTGKSLLVGSGRINTDGAKVVKAELGTTFKMLNPILKRLFDIAESSALQPNIKYLNIQRGNQVSGGEGK